MAGARLRVRTGHRAATVSDRQPPIGSDEFLPWAFKRRKEFAAGNLKPTQPKLREKASDDASSVITESDDTDDRPPEGDTRT